MAQFQRNKQAQVMTRLTDMLGVAVIIKLKENGEVRGLIEEIAAPALAEDFQRSLDLTQWKVRLESGEVMTVSGSQFSRIDYARA
jgi:small nuclear ribonucleoprotein (snRNP)-like protein